MSISIKDQVNGAHSYYGTFIINENNEANPNELSQTFIFSLSPNQETRTFDIHQSVSSIYSEKE